MKLPKLADSVLSCPMGELLSGSAFRPKAGDVSAPLATRFAQRPLLLLMVARDRAATLRVSYSAEGEPKVGESRQISRTEGGFAAALRAEASAAGASWVLVVLATGWQAEQGLRSTRSGEPARDAFERYRMASEHPEFLVPQPRAEYVYAPVDHPTLDRSVVFSFRRRELESILQELQSAGLELAGVRLGVASMLERWLGSGKAGALDRDLLLCDGTSVLLLNASGGDFGHASGGEQESRPSIRQVSSRPNDVAQDLVRLVRDNGERPLVFLGSGELLRHMKEELKEAAPEFQNPPEEDCNDPVLASLSLPVRHDISPSPKQERRPLPGRLRFFVNACLVLVGLSLAGTAFFAWQAWKAEARVSLMADRVARMNGRKADSERRKSEELKELVKARRLREWIVSGYHAQGFLHKLLCAIPQGVSLERMAAQLDEGSPQLSLEFSLLGTDESLIAAARAIEKEVLSMGCQIGERHQAVSGSSMEHRWRLILPVEKGGRL